MRKQYYQQFGDRQRLAAVFPPLLAYYRWFRRNRTWQDGSYWSTGWACGMDNQPRVSAGASPKWEHDHMSWIDTTAQAVFAARTLIKMGEALGRRNDTVELVAEVARLDKFINERMWHEQQGFYVDRRGDGSLSDVKSIAGFWPLLAGVAPPARRARLIAHLTNPRTFGRPHPVPSLAADHPAYQGEKGKYWLGSVWPSTNYMVLRGLSEHGADALAYQLGRRHVEMVTTVFENTNTYWENYAPEVARQGEPALADLVGWGGVGPIAVLLEYVLGLRPDFARQTLVWDVRLTDAHGVQDYPFGTDTTLNLAAQARARDTDPPVVTITANRPVRVEVRWPGGSRIIDAAPLS